MAYSVMRRSFLEYALEGTYLRDRKKTVTKIVYIAAAVCFILAIALIVLIRLLHTDGIAQWYSRWTAALMHYEQSVENIDEKWIAALFIEANFILKSFIPWLPISLLCFATGVIFKWYIAIPINIIGLATQFTIKYFWGKWRGGGNAQKLIAKNPSAYKVLSENDKIGSPIVLFASRFMPCMPVNAISQLYGSYDFSYWKYLVISILGFSYKLYSYTLVGRNVFDPLATKVLLPLIPLFFFSGIMLLFLNGALEVTITARRRIRLSRKKKTEEEQ